MLLVPHSIGSAVRCALLLAAMWPGAARAADERDLGRVYKGWKVSGFDVRGLDGDLAPHLEQGLALSGRSRFLWTTHPPFTPEILQEDERRTRLFLARNGYPYHRMDVRFEPDVEDQEVRVVLEIEPGPPVRVITNRVDAIPPPLEPQAEKILRLEPNEVFADERVEQRVRELLQLLQEAGYAQANVSTGITWEDSTHVLVDFQVVAGNVYWFGDTIAQGVDRDLRGVVVRTVDIDRGTRYSPKPIARATENLRVLELFRRVQVGTRPAGGDTLDLVADLAERTPRTVEVGFGYWSEDQVRGSFEWVHRNLLSHGRGGSAEAEYSRFVQRVTLSLWKPTLFRSRTRGVLRLGVRREAEISYTALVTELEASATYLYSLRTTLRPGLSITYTDLDSKTDASRAFRQPAGALTWLSFSWTRATLNDQLFPTRGSYARWYGEWGLPKALSESHYALADAEATFYEDHFAPFVLVARARGSLGTPLEDSIDLLPNKRFYAGGTSSMRGFRRHRLGPLDPAGVPLGGQARLEGTFEVRVPIWGRLSAAGFADFGQVWSRRHQVQLSDLDFAVGPGLSVRTPIGPVRADLGVRLGRDREQPRTVFHLSVGHAF
jgi:outer membrane protein assembly factor BamA